MKKILTFILFSLGCIGPVQSQTSCANAITVYPASTGDCNNSSGPSLAGQYQCPISSCGAVTMAGGTGGLDGSCAGNDATQSAYWIQITATTTSFNIYNDAVYTGSSASAYQANDYAIYSGSCGSLTPVGCYTIAGNSTQAITGLTAGQTYYVMVTPPNGYDAYTGFSACFTSAVAFSPTNNACASATSLSTNVSVTSTNAESTADGPGAVCLAPASGSVENNVWYQWCAPATWPVGQTAYISVSSIVCNNSAGLQVGVFGAGQTCGSFTSSMVCQNPGNVSNFYYSWVAAANQCYYINLDGFGGTACTFSITAGSVIVLPIELTIFEALNSSDRIQLKWETASELMCNYFSIEKSINGYDFYEIGSVRGSGTTSQVSRYTFDDSSPFLGENYYRLKQVDFNGTISYSSTISSNHRTINELYLTVHPNPIQNGNFQITARSERDAIYYFEILDLSGTIVYSFQKKLIGQVSDLFSISDFNRKGMYFLRAYNHNSSSLFKMIFE